MALEEKDTLQTLFRKSVPVKFIDDLIRRQEWIYQEARQQCFNNSLWTDAEARFMLGDTERALFESEMRKAAIVCGLRWEDANHSGLNCTYLKVSAGPFRISGHRAPTPRAFVQPCESRRQDAAVNRFLDYYVHDGLLCVPLPKLKEAKEIAIYILHGTTEDQDGKRTLFLTLAAPDSELERYQWIASLLEVKQGYVADSRAVGKSEALEDRAKPRPKVRPDAAEQENRK